MIARLLFVIATVACTDIQFADDWYNQNDQGFWRACISQQQPTPDGYYVQWWLSTNILYHFEIDWSGLSIRNPTYFQLGPSSLFPPWKTALPLGYFNNDFNAAIPALLISPRNDPKSLLLFVCSSDDCFQESSDAVWSLNKTISLPSSVPFFAKWEGLSANGPSDMFTKIFLYSTYSNLLLEISYPDFHSYNVIPLYKDNGLVFSRITGATFIQSNYFDYLFMGLGSANGSDPGEISLFNTSTTPATSVTNTYLEHSPTSFFSWANSFGFGLYWTSVNKADEKLNFYAYSLASQNKGELSNVTVTVKHKDCYEWGNAFGTQYVGNYALLTLAPCNQDPANSYFWAIEIYFGDDNKLQVSEIVSTSDLRSGTYVLPSFSLNLPDVSPAGVVFGLSGEYVELALFQFGQENRKKSAT